MKDDERQVYVVASPILIFIAALLAGILIGIYTTVSILSDAINGLAK